MTEFQDFPKMARWSRETIISEKIDGTNAQIYIGEDGEFLTGSRTRWITPEDDNFGFSRWAHANKEELMKLGPGRHFGEWWGQGIQRGYGLKEKRFSLFNASRWHDSDAPLEDREGRSLAPACCHVVPIIYRGVMLTASMEVAMFALQEIGSLAAPGFMDPEGVVLFHIAGNVGLKKTIKKDDVPKGKVQP